MKANGHTVLFEFVVPGLVEHALPVIDAWTQCGHRALIMASSDIMPAICAAHRGIKHQDCIEYQAFDDGAIDWQSINAVFNIIPAGPGPVFRDLHGRWDIPRITINHGLTDKAGTFPAAQLGHPIGYNNVLFSCGAAMFQGSWEKYVKKWPETPTSLKIIPVGSPKTDTLFDGTYQRDEILKELNLDPNLPTVLYAPTYQKEASLEQAGMGIIKTLAAMEINLLVRLHHLSLSNAIPSAVRDGHGGFDWRAALNDLVQHYPNLRHVEGDSNPYFVAADLLVGDVSGACFEYILQDKPVVFFDVPRFFKIHGRAGVGYWGRSAGCMVRDVEELSVAVREELEQPARYSAERARLIAQLVHQRGGAAKRAAETILGLIEGRIDYPIWGPRNNLRSDALLQTYILERLERCALETASVALFGAGVHAVYLLNLMREANACGRRMPKITTILDDNPSEATLSGIPVALPNIGQRTRFDAVILASDYHQARMRQRCNEVFGPDLPVIDLYSDFAWHHPGCA